MENIQIKNDIEEIINNCPFLSKFSGKTVLITGATGLIGSLLVKTLAVYNRKNNASITIVAGIRNLEKAEKVFADYSDAGIQFYVHDVVNKIDFDGKVDFIVHGASITSSYDFVEKPVETIYTAVDGTRNILEFAKSQNARVVYLSSMEVFGVTDDRLSEVKEENYGYIDILNPRSSYSESKRLCECLCSCFSAEYKHDVSVARLTQTLGAGISYNDTRVAAQFMRSAVEGKDIVLKTEGKTRRPIVYTSDAVAGIFTVLLSGKGGQSYTIANKNTIATIKETAEMVADKIAGGKIKVVFDINVPAMYAPNLNLNLNTDKLEALGWNAKVSLEEAYRRMIRSFE